MIGTHCSLDVANGQRLISTVDVASMNLSKPSWVSYGTKVGLSEKCAIHALNVYETFQKVCFLRS